MKGFFATCVFVAVSFMAGQNLANASDGRTIHRIAAVDYEVRQIAIGGTRYQISEQSVIHWPQQVEDPSADALLKGMEVRFSLTDSRSGSGLPTINELWVVSKPR